MYKSKDSSIKLFIIVEGTQYRMYFQSSCGPQSLWLHINGEHLVCSTETHHNFLELYATQWQLESVIFQVGETIAWWLRKLLHCHTKQLQKVVCKQVYKETSGKQNCFGQPKSFFSFAFQLIRILILNNLYLLIHCFPPANPWKEHSPVPMLRSNSSTTFMSLELENTLEIIKASVYHFEFVQMLSLNYKLSIYMYLSLISSSSP